MQDRFILTPLFLDEYDDKLESLAQVDWQVNRPVLPDGDTQHRMAAIHRRLAEAVAEAVGRGERPVSIAGDCCTTLGVMAGLQRTGMNPTMLWFDAHGDFNTWDTTPSGFLGGMPLAMMAGLGEQTMVDALGLSPIAEDRIILTDGRDLDPGERESIENAAVVHVADPIALLNYPFPDRPVYVHFDTDIIDPEEAPAMGYPAPDGPSSSELTRVFRHVAQATQIEAVSMSTWRPEMDTAGRSRSVCMGLLQALLDGE